LRKSWFFYTRLSGAQKQWHQGNKPAVGGAPVQYTDSARFWLQNFLPGFGPIFHEPFQPLIGQHMIGQFLNLSRRCCGHIGTD